MKRISPAQFEAYQLQVNSQIKSLTHKLEVLAALEKRVAQVLIEVLPARQARGDDQVPGYTMVKLKDGWVWKHFIRNTRSSHTFDTREACVKNAKRDALEQLAYGKQSTDIAEILRRVEPEKIMHRAANDPVLARTGREERPR